MEIKSDFFFLTKKVPFGGDHLLSTVVMLGLLMDPRFSFSFKKLDDDV